MSWLYYSDRLMELPLGIFAIAIATVILPTLSRIHAAAGDRAKYPGNPGLESAHHIMLLGLPATLALIVLAEPLIVTIYQHAVHFAGLNRWHQPQ